MTLYKPDCVSTVANCMLSMLIVSACSLLRESMQNLSSQSKEFHIRNPVYGNEILRRYILINCQCQCYKDITLIPLKQKTSSCLIIIWHTYTPAEIPDSAAAMLLAAPAVAVANSSSKPMGHTAPLLPTPPSMVAATPTGPASMAMGAVNPAAVSKNMQVYRLH